MQQDGDDPNCEKRQKRRERGSEKGRTDSVSCAEVEGIVPGPHEGSDGEVTEVGLLEVVSESLRSCPARQNDLCHHLCDRLVRDEVGEGLRRGDGGLEDVASQEKNSLDHRSHQISAPATELDSPRGTPLARSTPPHPSRRQSLFPSFPPPSTPSKTLPPSPHTTPSPTSSAPPPQKSGVRKSGNKAREPESQSARRAIRLDRSGEESWAGE